MIDKLQIYPNTNRMFGQIVNLNKEINKCNINPRLVDKKNVRNLITNLIDYLSQQKTYDRVLGVLPEYRYSY